MSPGSCVWECSSTFEILLHQGVHAHGSLALGASCPVRIAKKYNVAASSCMGFQTPQPKRKRLCRLFSSVALFSATNEDYEYRVYRPLGSRNTFIVSIAVTQLKHLQCSLVTSLRNRIQSVSPVVRRRQRKYTLTPISNRPSDVTAVGPWCIVVDRAHRASIASGRAPCEHRH